MESKFIIFSASGAEAGISVLTLGRPAGAEGGISEETFDVQIMAELRNCCIRRFSIYCLDFASLSSEGLPNRMASLFKGGRGLLPWSLFRVVAGLWAT